MGGAGAVISDDPTRNEFRIGAYSCPGPHVTESKFAPQVFRDILLFRVTERPDFIALNARAWEIDQGSILVLKAR
jgi:hypothetical protein